MYVLHRLTAIEAHPKTATEFNNETIQSDTYVTMVKSASNACKKQFYIEFKQMQWANS